MNQDPNFYRYYDCNLQCPKLKARKLRCPQIGTTLFVDDAGVTIKGDLTVEGTTNIEDASIHNLTLVPSGIQQYNGILSLNTDHFITSTMLPPLANPNCNGELMLFMTNDTTVSRNVVYAAIVKIAGTIQEALIFHRVGNFTSVDMYASGETSIRVQCNPASVLRWIYRGL